MCDFSGLNVMTIGEETSSQISEDPSLLRYSYVSCICRHFSLTSVLLALWFCCHLQCFSEA